MDLDIEMDVDDIQDAPVPAIPLAYTHDIITGEEQEPGEVDEELEDQGNGRASDQTVVPIKVHIRGLDTFNPDNVKGYLAEHYSTSQLARVEWIDDSSANFIFRSESTAQEALVALAAIEIADPTQLPPLEEIPAKSFSEKPECTLRIRFAVATDKKAEKASERSRFYLLNPEYDPEERRRRSEFNRGRYRDRDRGDRGDREDERRGPRDDEEPEIFDVNLYDDAPAKQEHRSPPPRRRSASSSSDTRRDSRRNREKELFPGRISGGGGLRDRSASPVRDRDGDAEMALDDDARAAAAMRSREKGRSIKERISRENSGKELFSSRDNSKPKDLFPSRVAASTGGRAQMDQVNDATVITTTSLADRITTPGSAPTSAAGGFSIRGMAGKRGGDNGIAIKGTGPTVKELFPEKFGNAGKELFAERLEGRGRRRQKAEDLFH
ncbi:hypothetical protein C8A05DRAFT_46260 [Staphylotrichum tortipilum]|uniref:Uncharacterized protein n=1 Tax=Staphylotrichum tortipilum TaxID=2831512 RepID=A0AAN6MFD5_9PEZI|nr:hypothetical protein C8A05DRAFT_46260 [Staphylotrichum longicolle]